MDVADIIKDSLKFSLDNPFIWAMMAILFFITSVLTVVSNNVGEVGQAIILIINLIVEVIVMGYCLKLVRNQIDGSEVTTVNVVDLATNVVDDFINGIKLLIVNIVYFIIPTIIITILGYLSGSIDKICNSILYVSDALAKAGASANVADVISTMPADMMTNLLSSFVFIAVVGVVLLVVFGLLDAIACAKLAETGDVLASLNFIDVAHKIGDIGVVKYFVFIVLLAVMLVILALVSGIVEMIPGVGSILAATIVTSFTSVFTYVAIGKLYADAY